MKERKKIFDKNQKFIGILTEVQHILQNKKIFPCSNLPYQRKYLEDLNINMDELKMGNIALFLY